MEETNIPNTCHKPRTYADAMENLKRVTKQTIAGEQIVEYGAKVDYKKMSDIFGDSIPKE